MDLQRIQEETKLYQNPAEVSAYVKLSKSIAMVRLERNFAREILRHHGEKEHLEILDIGCGPAWISQALAKARPHWKVTCLDGSQGMLEAARKNAEAENIRMNYVHADAGKIPQADERFDLVISHFAFSEFPKPELCLKEMLRVTKKGGEIMIRDLRRPSHWVWNYLKFTSLFYYFGKAVMRRQFLDSLQGAYTESELASLVEKSLGKAGTAEIKGVSSLAIGGRVDLRYLKNNQT